MEKISNEDKFTFKIILPRGGEVRSFTLTGDILKYAIASLAVVSVCFVFAFTWAAYGVLQDRADREAVREVQQSSSRQQEQLTKIMKRISALQEEMDKLDQQDNELKQLSLTGSLPQQSTAVQGGQGGPLVQPGYRDLNLMLDQLEARAKLRQQKLDKMQEMLHEQLKNGFYGADTFSTVPSGWPTTGEISSPYGLRWGGSDFHPGIDIADDYGTPIYATAAGTVTYAGWNSGGYGNMVEIDHGNGFTTLFGHAEQVVVYAGQQVRKGELIAYMGSTGYSTGPHVHYEIYVNGVRVNPVNYF